MIGTDTFRQFTLSLPHVTEEPHFDKTSFRIGGKIFATMVAEHHRATVKLSPTDQCLFCLADANMVYPVPNKWGKLGWTHLNLQTVLPEMCTEILKVAYCEVAPKKYAALITFDE
ncbi:MmcQ/YjbR family DNA-binding protein [Mucilaginibacter pedocola]|uniref:MmcQ-like protein n=1 Tax=Mucilaginibacter pedocola TaxID=1792845 RepID=A0A1S9PF88_9SPHI|nr:MmcQ/YjbR family DNA-binding protein [Mucilaginibacter pedocola]OOQ59625.1 hypothetical protein BC343_05525 [Mucilaginibacter pedocola]